MTNTDTLQVAVVGAGNRGHSHTDAVYSRVPDAEVAAVADVDEDAAEAFAAEHGVETVYADYRDAVADPGIDLVDVCVHNNLHAPVAVDALAADAHVYCEKPMAGSYADARRMAEAAGESDGELAVQNWRLVAPGTRAARRLIEAGELGELRYAHAAHVRTRGRPYLDGYGTASFVDESTAAGGAVLDVGVYPIGQLLYLLGNPDVERISGVAYATAEAVYTDDVVGDNADRYRERLAEADDVEDVGMAFVRLEGGVVLTVNAAWSTYLDDPQGSAVVGTTGGLELDPPRLSTTVADVELTAEVDADGFGRRERLFDDREVPDEVLGHDLYHFLRSLSAGEPFVDSAAIALNAQLVMEGIYRSSELGREVAAEEVAERSASTALDP